MIKRANVKIYIVKDKMCEKNYIINVCEESKKGKCIRQRPQTGGRKLSFLKKFLTRECLLKSN